MSESFAPVAVETGVSDLAKAEALHALGAFYLRQGFPKQGLALLLAAAKFAVPTVELNRALAHAYVLAGAPQKALALLDTLSRGSDSDAVRRGAARLRGRALLALGRVADARAAFADSLPPAPRPSRPAHFAERVS